LNLKSNASVPNFQSDGLTITAAEPWFKVKVQVILSYVQAFIMNASPKSDELIFVDLFAGSGLYSAGHQKDVFASASLAALSSNLPFQKWIFFEADKEQADALDKRVQKIFPQKYVEVFNVREDEIIQTINSTIPPFKPGRRAAVFCLIDPFSLNFSINTVDRLASMGFNLLMPFTFPLNARLDCHHYCDDQAEMIKKFLGANNYERLLGLDSNAHFYRKLVQVYQTNLLVKGLNSALSSHKLESKMMALQAYTIGFFSRQFSAQSIQRDVNVSEHLQFELFPR
jgi:three-Cys-motif partner protein